VTRAFRSVGFLTIAVFTFAIWASANSGSGQGSDTSAKVDLNTASEANKDQLSDPDKIKPGIDLLIP